MQNKRRWMTSVLEETAKTEVKLPWARESRTEETEALPLLRVASN
ncbi:hypothetical protein [Actibacterium lipolyticum]|uniref:Uncharacterized protein n=1 Tax=Actibacterium lipolyticum TaxID=1524263 RepID=A0A238JNG2_9RHOB|nr:hypothetical protein [Actibacterium lipolyticum]SMX31727.1 hypothetical protein COL8621_00586 [Actibacterium lipolyticum]